MVDNKKIIDRSEVQIAYKTKLGIKMFFIYAIIYFGFVLINTIKPTLMDWAIFDLNLAVIYGFGLIIVAVVLALIYNYYCSKIEDSRS